MRGEITIGETIFVIISMLNLLEHSWIVTDEFPYFCKELGTCKQAIKVLQDENKEPVTSSRSRKIKVTRGEIRFHKVSFQYKRNSNVFKDKSLTIEGGQKVGLVGLSGSGKSTFVHLILRLTEVNSGKITIDKQDIANIDVNSLRNSISLMHQEPLLFHRTIMENIRYGDCTATDEEVYEAAKKANCHGFITEMQDDYGTVVGENGAKLSMGQRQRIAIARTILKNAPILIMDEVTSALDAETENKIKESIKYLSRDKTTIVIAHKFSTLEEVDRILVFDQGTIVEDGVHKELLKEGGLYSTLWRMQTAGILPERIEV